VNEENHVVSVASIAAQVGTHANSAAAVGYCEASHTAYPSRTGTIARIIIDNQQANPGISYANCASPNFHQAWPSQCRHFESARSWRSSKPLSTLEDAYVREATEKLWMFVSLLRASYMGRLGGTLYLLVWWIGVGTLGFTLSMGRRRRSRESRTPSSAKPAHAAAASARQLRSHGHHRLCGQQSRSTDLN